MIAGVAAAAVMSPVPAAAVVGTDCARFIAVLVPGTTETTASADPSRPAGLLGSVGEELKKRYGASIQTVYPNYAAQAFVQTGMSYATSKTGGVQSVSNAMARCPASSFVLAGYSQGADVANDVAVNIGAGRGPVPASAVRAVVLVANPKNGTQGSQVVGPKLDGQGIAGPATEGFGALSGRVFDICNPGDKYCNTNAGQDTFLASLGRVLANPPGAVASTAASAAATTATASIPNAVAPANTDSPTPNSLPTGGDAAAFVDGVSTDYGIADLSSAPGAAQSLASAVERLQSAPSPNSTAQAAEVAAVRQQAQLVSGTFAPIAQTQQWMAANPAARAGLREAPADSPEAVTNSVVDALDQVDVPKVLTAADSVVQLANTILSSTSGGAASTTPTASFAELRAPAQSLSSSVAPLTSTPLDQLQTATSVLSAIKPVTIINQILNVVAAVTSVDYPGVVANLQALVGDLLAGNIKAAHQVAGELNNQLSPFVKMTAGVDLKSIAQLLRLIPDPSGTAAIASMIVDLLGNVDVIRMARDVGQIQEVAWQVAETGNLLALGQLLPLGLDLANVALGIFVPGQKMSPEQLHAPADALTTLMGAQAANSDFVGLGNSALTAATSPNAMNLTELLDEGFTAASFLGSKAHEAYNTWLIDGKRTALQVVVDIATKAIGG
ncbi:cutinase family protein [Rhodococcus sp. NPDC019627]|uniref:cutinase family protein n=1 Tax=Rhodococcus sp. NPDC019627 TaxID=3364505 RepID=UPI00379EF264